VVHDHEGFYPRNGTKILRDNEWIPNYVARVVAGPNVISSAALDVARFMIAKDSVRLGTKSFVIMKVA